MKNVFRRFEEVKDNENERKRRMYEGQLVNQEAQRISKEEVKVAMKTMKSGKLVGPDNMPVELCRCVGEK